MTDDAGDDEDNEDAGGDDAAVLRLLSLLRAREGAPVPTSTFGRFRRTATTAARAAAGAAARRLTGGELLDDKAVERLVLSMGELKGVAMKVGQIMSYVDAPIPEGVRKQLAILQSQSQPTPFSEIERVVREDLPAARADALLATIERMPVSTASIGQVHRATLPSPGEGAAGVDDDGRARGGATAVAVKVRNPDIERAIRADFRGASVGKQLARLLGGDVSSLIAEAESTLLEECDYVSEAEHQERFAALYAGDDDVTVPAVHRAYCGARVLTTTWHEGASFDAFRARAAQDTLDRAGRAIYRFYVGTFYEHGFFNADPHPGNLLFHDDGAVVFLDYGCVRSFTPAHVHAVAGMSRAVRDGDDDGIVAAFRDAGAEVPDRGVAVELARAFFLPVVAPGARPMEVGFRATLAEVMRDKRALMKMRLPGELLFLVRIRFGVYSVLARLGAKLDWRALEARAADR